MTLKEKLNTVPLHGNPMFNNAPDDMNANDARHLARRIVYHYVVERNFTEVSLLAIAQWYADVMCMANQETCDHNFRASRDAGVPVSGSLAEWIESRPHDENGNPIMSPAQWAAGEMI